MLTTIILPSNDLNPNGITDLSVSIGLTRNNTFSYMLSIFFSTAHHETKGRNRHCQHRERQRQLGLQGPPVWRSARILFACHRTPPRRQIRLHESGAGIYVYISISIYVYIHICIYMYIYIFACHPTPPRRQIRLHESGAGIYV